MRILVIDDDEETLELVERALEREGHRVLVARTRCRIAPWDRFLSRPVSAERH